MVNLFSMETMKNNQNHKEQKDKPNLLILFFFPSWLASLFLRIILNPVESFLSTTAQVGTSESQ